MAELKLGIIGLDTSHVIAFTSVLNDKNNEYHVPGGKVVVAFPGGSPDFELSISRVSGYTEELKNKYDVKIVNSPEEVAKEADAILLESVDGRVHLEQFKRIAPFGKPTFIDKPFAVKSSDAREMIQLAKGHNLPLMSSSALRFSEALTEVLSDESKGTVIGADFYGPMAIQETQPGFFWYGIHTVDMLFATLGTGCTKVTTTTNDDHDLVVGVWSDGRIGTIRGNRAGNSKFGGLVHRTGTTEFVDVYSKKKPYYASLLERIMAMFTAKKIALDINESLEVVRFIEAANESRDTGKTVRL
ncbi:MAG: Gfo/Idh/MocA family oxidoreductase [Firmicutes bacterium]|nr:Gfo/Idh/MocA family oxidoreductase [Bacillota bacterium]MDD4264796.1 Gfo/Idh/MocA family oxidoreductase [Bacillota bacterium]MDD4694406.1 Gfo/Idh/MocA family oxidoreductase [Bacillota bacterium]